MYTVQRAQAAESTARTTARCQSNDMASVARAIVQHGRACAGEWLVINGQRLSVSDQRNSDPWLEATSVPRYQTNEIVSPYSDDSGDTALIGGTTDRTRVPAKRMIRFVRLSSKNFGKHPGSSLHHLTPEP